MRSLMGEAEVFCMPIRNALTKMVTLELSYD